MKLNGVLTKTIEALDPESINAERQNILGPLIEYIQGKIDRGESVQLNFICTHNSRRSQFSQIWAKTAADYYGLEINSYSGGVEVTAFNERAVKSLQRAGFRVTKRGKVNSVYSVYYADDVPPIKAFSKLYDDPINPKQGYAAIMTCSHADENCPFIPGAESRMPVRYEDPKEFDDTPLETIKYDERSIQIATEMFYVFSKVKKLT